MSYDFVDYGLDGYSDGYSANLPQYSIGPRYVDHKQQINVKLTEEDLENISEINKRFFEDEASNSMIGRILIRKGIAFYKNLKS